MKCLKFLFILFAFFQIKQTSSQIKDKSDNTSIKGLDEWEYISENKIGVKFYFKNPVGRDNNVYTFWALMFYSNPKYPSQIYGSVHIEQVVSLNIHTRKWYTKRVVIFDKEEKVMQIHDYTPDWQKIVPNSFVEIMLMHFLSSKI